MASRVGIPESRRGVPATRRARYKDQPAPVNPLGVREIRREFPVPGSRKPARGRQVAPLTTPATPTASPTEPWGMAPIRQDQV